MNPGRKPKPSDAKIDFSEKKLVHLVSDELSWKDFLGELFILVKNRESWGKWPKQGLYDFSMKEIGLKFALLIENM